MIVDDEDDMRSLLRNMIEIANDGLLVAGEAADGDQALRFWREAQPDVQALVEPVEPGRVRRPVEVGQVQPVRVARKGGAVRRAVGHVGKQPGDDEDGQSNEEHGREDRGQPRPAQGAAPQPRSREWVHGGFVFFRGAGSAGVEAA